MNNLKDKLASTIVAQLFAGDWIGTHMCDPYNNNFNERVSDLEEEVITAINGFISDFYNRQVKGMFKEFFKGLTISLFVFTSLITCLALPNMNADEIKLVIGLPVIVALSFYFGVYITKKERARRIYLNKKRICSRKKALQGGHLSNAHTKINS